MFKIIILAVFLTGCFMDGEGEYSEATSVWIDGCEYIVTDGGVCHKGNCRNPIHEEE